MGRRRDDLDLDDIICFVTGSLPFWFYWLFGLIIFIAGNYYFIPQLESGQWTAGIADMVNKGINVACPVLVLLGFISFIREKIPFAYDSYEEYGIIDFIMGRLPFQLYLLPAITIMAVLIVGAGIVIPYFIGNSVFTNGDTYKIVIICALIADFLLLVLGLVSLVREMLQAGRY